MLSKNSERLLFFFIIFVLICHIMGCFWIYVGFISNTEDFVANDGTIQNYNWISANGYDNYTDT